MFADYICLLFALYSEFDIQFDIDTLQYTICNQLSGVPGYTYTSCFFLNLADALFFIPIHSFTDIEIFHMRTDK